jgi:hypothetical protein
MTDEDTEAPRAQVAREDRSLQELPRSAIRIAGTRRAVTRDASLPRIVAEDRELLDRLAQ